MKLREHVHRPELAVASEDSRPALACAHLDVDAGLLYASDSFLMVALPVEVDEIDESGPVPIDALVKARGRRGELLCSNGSVRVPGYATFDRPAVHGPNFAQLMATNIPPDAETTTVVFNVDILHRACQALGARNVELVFYPARGETRSPEEQAIGIRDLDRPDVVALVTPQRKRGQS